MFALGYTVDDKSGRIVSISGYSTDIKHQLLKVIVYEMRQFKQCIEDGGRSQATYQTAAAGKSVKKSRSMSARSAVPAEKAWFINKSDAVVEVARAASTGERSYADAFSELRYLRMEILPGWKALGGTGDPECVEALDSFSQAVDFLCLALRDPDSVEMHFLGANFAAVHMETRLYRAKSFLAQWSGGHWSTQVHNNVLQEVIKGVSALVDCTRNIAKVSLEGADSCDPKVMKEKLEALCRHLIEVRRLFEEVICKLERLKCSAEPTFYDRVIARLNGAAYYLVDVLSAVDSICVPEEDVNKGLSLAWSSLNASLLKLKDRVDSVTPGLCSQTPNVRPSITTLLSYADQGLRGASAFQGSFLSPKARDEQLQLAGKIHALLTKLVDEGCLRRRLVSGCSWLVARIRFLLSRCEAEARDEEHCLLTRDEVCKIVEWFKSNLSGGPFPGTVTPCTITTTAQQESAPSSEASIGAAINSIGQWTDFEKFATVVYGYVPENLKAVVSDSIAKAKSAQRRLSSSKLPGGMTLMEVAKFEQSTLNAQYHSLAATLAVYCDRVPAGEKLNLIGLSAQYPAYQYMKRLTGLALQ